MNRGDVPLQSVRSGNTFTDVDNRAYVIVGEREAISAQVLLESQGYTVAYEYSYIPGPVLRVWSDREPAAIDRALAEATGQASCLGLTQGGDSAGSRPRGRRPGI